MTRFLFSTITQAKDLGCYEIANRAFAVLLCHALQQESEEVTITIASDCESKEEAWEDYYSLLVIEQGTGYACIPLPLVKEEVLNILRTSDETDWIGFSERGEHNREPMRVTEPVRKQLLQALDWSLWRMYPRCKDEAERLLNIEPLTPEGWECSDWVSIFNHTDALRRSMWKPTYWEFRRDSLLPQESWGFNDVTLWDILSYVPELIRQGYTQLWDVE
jgi:hypothetical protein